LSLYPEELSSVVGNQGVGREAHLLELLGVRGGNLSTSNPGGRGLEVVKGVLAGESHNLAGDAEAGETRLDAEHVASLLDRLDNGFYIERLDGAQVDDLGLNTVLGLELFGGNEGLADAAGEGNDGKVLAGALDLGLSEL
jgi:hypothetical protein